jgi:hypothetical protein
VMVRWPGQNGIHQKVDLGGRDSFLSLTDKVHASQCLG